MGTRSEKRNGEEDKRLRHMKLLQRPKAESVKVRLRKTQTRVLSGTTVWYADWILYQVNANSLIGQHYYRASLVIPCRSNLHKFLTGLLLNWDWAYEGDTTINEEQAKYLEIIFNNQREYTFWKEGLRILKMKGREAAWQWVEDKMPLLLLKNKLERQTNDKV